MTPTDYYTNFETSLPGHGSEKNADITKTHDELIRQKKLPRVGQTIRSKKYGTLWRVMEKREAWQMTNDDPPRLISAIYLAYWRITNGVLPGTGRMMGYVYTLDDTTFETNWEIAD